MPDAKGFFDQVSSGVVYEVDTSEPAPVLEAIEESPVIETPGERVSVVLLWNWADVVPDWECDLLNLPMGSTYAQALRKVALDLELPSGRETVQVEIDTDSIEELKTVHCLRPSLR